MQFNVSGDLTLGTGSSLLAENRRGGGNGGNISLTVGGNLTVQGTVGAVAGARVSSSRISGGGTTAEHAGTVTFDVTGNITLEPGSAVAANAASATAGAVNVHGAGQISLLGLITSGPSSQVLSTALTGKVLNGGDANQASGSINITCDGFTEPGILVGS